MFGKHNLRFSPLQEALRGSIVSINKTESETCTVELKGNRSMQVECATGFVKKFYRSRGDVTEFWLQFNEFESAFPRVAGHGVVKDGHLVSVEVRFIDGAEFNVDLGLDAFSMYSNRDGQVMDLRKGKDQITLVTVKQGEDVLAAANKETFSPVVNEEINISREGGLAAWFSPALFFCFCLVFSGCLLFLKRVAGNLLFSKG